MLPLRIAVDLLQPSPPIESSLHLMLIPFVQIRHRSMDLAYHPGLGPLPDRSRSRNDYSRSSSSQLLFARTLSERFVSSDAPSHSRGPRSRGFPSPKHWSFSRESHSQPQMRFASRRSPSQHQMLFASSELPSPREWTLHHGGHPLQSEWHSHQEGYPLQSE